MSRRFASFGEFIKRFPRWRWIVNGLAVLGIVLFELIEHRPLISGRPFEADLLRDILFYGVVAYFASNYIVNRLQHLSLAYDQSRTSYNNLQELIGQLIEAEDYPEASVIYLQTLRANLPIRGAQLLLKDPSDGRLIHTTSWAHDSVELPVPIPRLHENVCSLNRVNGSKGNFAYADCICSGNIREREWSYRYCLPLNISEQLRAILFLYATEALVLSADQEKLMHNMASEYAITLERIQLQITLDQHRSSHANVQQRIARDMHDTLGHNLAYMRMKLDQISAEFQSMDEVLLKDLLQLRDSANESYQQMRDLLVLLVPERTPGLRSTMTKYAQKVADRAGFNLEIQYTGETQLLPPPVLQQIVLIVREVLANIEKHARATQVVIRIDWRDDGLWIQIEDNGRGFDTGQPLSDEQLGLHFMKERAVEVDGDLTLSSTINAGTKISLWVPSQPAQ